MNEINDAGELSLNAEDEQKQLGLKIREAREFLGLSQEFLADALNIPRPSISAVETGKRKVSGIEIKQLSRILKQPVAYFLGEIDLSFEEPSHPTLRSLFRATKALSESDKEQVLRFAQFLRQTGQSEEPDQE
jgi:transcriptional regulator with XRE-family HTH domain